VTDQATSKEEIDLINLIADQIGFVEWLKDRDMYNPMESADTMRKMHRVWKAATAKPPQKPQQREVSQ